MLYVVTSKIFVKKKPWEIKNTVLYTKYKAENNALWTIYVKYGLKIYRVLEIWVWKSMEFWNEKCVGTL